MQTRITSVGLIRRSDPADNFVYPAHIERSSIDALPAHPGIYIFRDAASVPLYIGKSVNIRSRVLSHLRNPEEARLLQQTTHIDFQRTAGEIGALLLESQLIKQLQPVFNKKLRRVREMCSLRLATQSGSPEVVTARDLDFARTAGLFGLFATRKAALEKLRSIIEQHMLCPAIAGLEVRTRGRACFARQISRCLGACCGDEALDTHQARLTAALEHLRVMPWPYAGPMAIVEQYEGWEQLHVIDCWSYIGSIDRKKRTKVFKPTVRVRFDADTYYILAKPLLRDELLLSPLPNSSSS